MICSVNACSTSFRACTGVRLLIWFVSLGNSSARAGAARLTATRSPARPAAANTGSGQPGMHLPDRAGLQLPDDPQDFQLHRGGLARTKVPHLRRLLGPAAAKAKAFAWLRATQQRILLIVKAGEAGAAGRAGEAELEACPCEGVLSSGASQPRGRGGQAFRVPPIGCRRLGAADWVLGNGARGSRAAQQLGNGCGRAGGSAIARTMLEKSDHDRISHDGSSTDHS